MSTKDTAFVIGTGPSLKNIDVSLLKDYTTITFNRAYVAFEDWGFDPTYYLAIDGNDMRSMYKDINNLIVNSKIQQFFFAKINDNEIHPEDSFQDGDRCSSKDMFIDSPKVEYFSPIRIVTNAGWMGIEVLASLGYKNIAFVGCDCRYKDDQESNKDITIVGSEYKSHADTDINHFRPDYFGKGISFGKPNENEILQIWKSGANKMKDRNINLISCTKNSKANEWYEYIPFEQYIKNI